MMHDTTDNSEHPDHKEYNTPTTVGSHIDVIFLGINENMVITGKVDTGAVTTSLGVEHLHVNPDPLHNDQFTVKFEYNNKNYTMKATHMQSVESADGGTHNRPVVTLSVKFKETTIPDVEVNLNDRTKMPDHLLIGENLLSQLDIVIDPSIGVDEAAIEEMDISFDGGDNTGNSVTVLPDDDLNNQINPDDASKVDSTVDPIQQILAIIAAHPELTLQSLFNQTLTTTTVAAPIIEPQNTDDQPQNDNQ